MNKIIAAMLLTGLVASPLAFAQDTTKHTTTQHSTTHTQTRDGQTVRTDKHDMKDHETKKDMDNKDMDNDSPDTWLMTKVKSSFAVTEGIDATDISVSVNDGVVYLTGDVGSKAELDKAKSVAQGIDGVKSVDVSKVKMKK